MGRKWRAEIITEKSWTSYVVVVVVVAWCDDGKPTVILACQTDDDDDDDVVVDNDNGEGIASFAAKGSLNSRNVAFATATVLPESLPMSVASAPPLTNPPTSAVLLQSTDIPAVQAALHILNASSPPIPTSVVSIASKSAISTPSPTPTMGVVQLETNVQSSGSLMASKVINPIIKASSSSSSPVDSSVVGAISSTTEIPATSVVPALIGKATPAVDADRHDSSADDMLHSILSKRADARARTLNAASVAPVDNEYVTSCVGGWGGLNVCQSSWLPLRGNLLTSRWSVQSFIRSFRINSILSLVLSFLPSFTLAHSLVAVVCTMPSIVCSGFDRNHSRGRLLSAFQLSPEQEEEERRLQDVVSSWDS
jgi:hypothetical protein